MVAKLIKSLKTYNDPRFWVENIVWRFPATISDTETVFVVGAPRSGTTLLQRVLSVHSQLFSIERETGIFSYRNIFEPKQNYFDLPEPQFRLILDNSTDIVNFFDNVVRILKAENGNKRFVEKTPQHVLYLPFILKHFPKSAVIHIVRDGRDCYCSSKSHPDIPQNQSATASAKYWKKCVRIPARYRDAILTVSYEDFVSETKKTLTKIMDFIHYKVEDSQLDPLSVGDDARANLKHFERLKSPISSASVARWKEELTDKEVYEFERIARKELELYGY